jgi:2-amino-4-hydroxy-6-hydroxymethyldihydropteridine diphosphokinase
MHLRAFVLLPLKDLAPGMMLEGKRLEEWVEGVGGQDILRLRVSD